MSFLRRLLFILIVALSGTAFIAADFQVSYAQTRTKQKKKPGFFERLFGPRQTTPLFKKPSRIKKKRAPSEAPVETVEVSAKDPKARKVLVIGDFVAGGLAWGLDQAFANQPKIAVIDKSNAGSGLVRVESYDWNKALLGILNEVKPDIVVVALGVNDRQQMREGNTRVPVGSVTWQATYTARIEGVVDTLKVYGRPFFWISAPPLRVSDASADMVYFNGLYRPRVEAAGGHYVDIWSGFTNASGQYITTGPDIEGQVRALRAGDGINFTRAGRLKLSFYVEREIRRQTGVGAGAVDLLASVSNTSQIEIGPDGKKRLVGPVISLSDPLPGGSDTLAGAPPPTAYDPVTGVVIAPPPAKKEEKPPEDSVEYKLVVKGDPPPAAGGRVDDFAWPPQARPAPTFVSPDESPDDAADDATGAEGEEPLAPVSPKKASLTPVSKSSN